MLNCVNSLEPQSMNSGIEHAALMISEEKTIHDSRKNEIPTTYCELPTFYLYPSFVYLRAKSTTNLRMLWIDPQEHDLYVPFLVSSTTTTSFTKVLLCVCLIFLVPINTMLITINIYWCIFTISFNCFIGHWVEEEDNWLGKVEEVQTSISTFSPISLQIGDEILSGSLPYFLCILRTVMWIFQFMLDVKYLVLIGFIF